MDQLKDHKSTVTCIDGDKKRLVTGGLDRLIFVYDSKDYQWLGKLESHKGGVRCLKLRDNRLFSGSWDCSVIIWDMVTFKPTMTISLHKDSITCLCVDSKYLLVNILLQM